MSTPDKKQTVRKKSPGDAFRQFRNNFSPTFGAHRPKIIVPLEHRSNFKNLYFEIAWYAVLNGTILSFLSIFATRSGANTQQIGYIGAAPAIANLIFSIPASVYMQKLPTARVVFLSALAQRIFYLGFAILPFFISSTPLIWVLIIGTFLLSIPGTGLAVGMNALIAETVPVEWRAHVVSRRNMLLSLFTILSLALSGQILTRLTFPINYQVVFFIGFVGAMMSCLHLFLIRPHTGVQANHQKLQLEEIKVKSPSAHVRLEIHKKMHQASQPQKPSFKALKGKYALVLLILFMFWFALYLAIPLFPIYQVNVLHLTDQTISLGSSFSSLVTLLGTTQIGALSRRFSNQKLTAIGISLATIYPVFLPLCQTPTLFILVSAVGGIGWGAINTCLVNYLLEQIPNADLASHLAWYNIALNAAILAGAIFGPLIAGHIGLTAAIVIFGFGRLLAGLALLRWG